MLGHLGKCRDKLGKYAILCQKKSQPTPKWCSIPSEKSCGWLKNNNRGMCQQSLLKNMQDKYFMFWIDVLR